MLPEISFHITSYLPAKDKNNFALSSKALYTPARQKMIYEDIRGLKDKEWMNGPTRPYDGRGLERKSFSREFRLKYDLQPTLIETTQYTASAHYNAGINFCDLSQKRLSFMRAAKPYDRLFGLNPDQPILCLEASMTVYDFIGARDKAQEIRARMENLAASAQTS